METQSLTATIDWIPRAEAWLDEHAPTMIEGAIDCLLVLLVGWIVVRLVAGATRRLLEKRGLSTLLKRFLVTIVRRVLWIVVIVIALSELGLDVAPLIAGLGVSGFIIGFAFQETLGNFAAGLMLLVNEPFKEGDWIEVASTAGTVTDLTVMATTLKTPDNKIVTIPNRKVWGDKIVNFNAMSTRRIDLVVGVGYSTELGRVISVLKEVVTGHELVLAEPAPAIAVLELGASSVDIVVRPWVETPNYWAVRFDLTRRIKDVFDREGIEIPFPQMDLHVRDTPEGGASKAA